MKDRVILIEVLIDKVEKYIETSVELCKLKAIDKSSTFFASLVSRSIIAIFITLFLLFSTIGFAFYLGELMGKLYYGFFAVSGLYAFLAIVFLIFRKPYLKKILNNYFINQIFKEK